MAISCPKLFWEPRGQTEGRKGNELGAHYYFQEGKGGAFRERSGQSRRKMHGTILFNSPSVRGGGGGRELMASIKGSSSGAKKRDDLGVPSIL